MVAKRPGRAHFRLNVAAGYAVIAGFRAVLPGVSGRRRPVGAAGQRTSLIPAPEFGNHDVGFFGDRFRAGCPDRAGPFVHARRCRHSADSYSFPQIGVQQLRRRPAAVRDTERGSAGADRFRHLSAAAQAVYRSLELD